MKPPQAKEPTMQCTINGETFVIEEAPQGWVWEQGQRA
jgi:hypothetical protein